MKSRKGRGAEPFFGIFLLLLFLMPMGLMLSVTFGIGNPTQGSYTGMVVDTTEQQGIFWKTSEVELKTNPEASEGESFCILNNKEKQLQELKRYLENGQRVTIEYDRPAVMPPWRCPIDAPPIEEIQVAGGQVQ